MITLLYIIACLGWGWFAIITQVNVYPNSSDRRIVLAFIIHVIAAPFLIWYAAYGLWKGTFEITRSKQ